MQQIVPYSSHWMSHIYFWLYWNMESTGAGAGERINAISRSPTT